MRRKTRPLVGFFLRQGIDMETAEDLTQEVFLRLYRHAPRYRAEERFAPYCLRVARNVWIDHRRRRGVRPLEAGLEGDPSAGDSVAAGAPGADPARQAEDAEDARRFALALGQLAPHHRDVFELAGLQELGYGDVARLLEIPIGTVKSRMFYAIRKLREILGDGV